ncbi:hypothetical protein AAAK29_30455 [Mesorhizobium sp. CCNWLW179-1]|uniref:hypothetical protein n=1 Tax=unclassified Mesorhizobium TaxID=325217 RepID=UPI0030148889
MKSTPEYRYDPNMEVSRETIKKMQELFIKDGSIESKEPIPYEKVVPVAFREAVLKSLSAV